VKYALNSIEIIEFIRMLRNSRKCWTVWRTIR